MRHLFTSLAASVLLLALAPVHAASVTLKLGHATFESHPNHDTAVRFKAAVERLSKGEVKIQIYPARQLGDVKELVQGVQFGTIDMAVNASSAYAQLAPAVDAFQLPWIIDSYAHFARLAKAPETRSILDTFETHNTIALGLYEGGRRHFLSVKRPVRTADDFKGLKTRVAPVRLFLDIWKAVGVNPTPMSYGEVYSALETSTLDAVEINLTSIESEKYYEIAKNLTLTGHYFWPSVLVINKDKFEQLSPAQRDAIRKAADEIIDPQVKAVEELDNRLISEFPTRGMQVINPSAQLIAAMRDRVTPVLDTYSRKDPLIARFITAANRTRSAAKP